jgi:hypothetical protein
VFNRQPSNSLKCRLEAIATSSSISIPSQAELKTHIRMLETWNADQHSQCQKLYTYKTVCNNSNSKFGELYFVGVISDKSYAFLELPSTEGLSF